MKFLRKNSSSRLHYEFLPAAEEIVESPPSPFGRIVLWLTMLLLAIAMAWSYLGKIDVIASAQGKVIPEGNIKVVQPAGQAMIKAIKVTEGQQVKKGQLLVEFDATVTAAAVQALEKSLEVAKLERDVLKKIDVGDDPADMIAGSAVADQIKHDLLLLAQSKRAAVDIRRELLVISITQAQTQAAAEKQNQQLTETNLRAAQDAQARLEKTLAQAPDTSRARLQLELQDSKNQVANLQNTLVSQKQRVAQADASISQAHSNLKNYNAETSSTTLSTVLDQDKKIIELEDSLVGAKKDLELQSLASPVDGIVLSLGATTIGGVVTAAQPLVTIVPSDALYIIEANLSTSDVGFVKTGQKVTVKVDTFSFQRYGYLTGTVQSIGADAVSDEKDGLMYKLKVKLDETKTSKDNTIQLIPGMTVTGEVITGQRRIVEFFLDPLITHTDESLKVR